MEPINVLQAHNALSKLVTQAQAGAEIVISKRGIPVARLVAVAPRASQTAAAAAVWISEHRIPAAAARTASELDAQIESERTGWE
ncbi:MAG: type II toxin-antitoxin system prevent-host-death family antitoxin [Actinomycetota bacterium]